MVVFRGLRNGGSEWGFRMGIPYGDSVWGFLASESGRAFLASVGGVLLVVAGLPCQESPQCC